MLNVLTGAEAAHFQDIHPGDPHEGRMVPQKVQGKSGNPVACLDQEGSHLFGIRSAVLHSR